MHFIENHSRLVTFSERDEDKSLVPILAFLSILVIYQPRIRT